MTTFIIDPPKPHGRKQALIMQGFLHPGLEEIWIANGTKWGKSISAATGLVTAAISKPNSIMRWVAPIYSQSKIGMSYCRKILPPEPYVNINLSGMEVKITGNHSRIQFYHAQNPVSLEGYGIHGYVFDEAAKIKEDAYASAKTTVTMTRGLMIFISTPLGKNWFHRKCMEARDEMERAQFEKRAPKKIFITAPTADNPYVPRESIEAARKSMSARLFRQFFEASFEDDGNVFTNFRDCLWTDELDIYGDDQIWIHENAKKSQVVIGIDWAKTLDYCVFIAIDVETRKVVGVQRFHKHPYQEAIRRAVLFSRKFAETLVVYHDKTGVGQAIDDQLSFTDLNYRGINFTNASKAEMVNRLNIGFEQKSIFIPSWPTLLRELDEFEVEATEIGTLRYGGTGHDDTVAALMLAHAALLEYANRNLEMTFLDALKPDAIDAMHAYYRDLDDDDD